MRESCPARATRELLERSAQLEARLPYRKVAKVTIEFLPLKRPGMRDYEVAGIACRVCQSLGS